MKIGRLAILVLSICLLVAPLMAYTLDSGSVSETECNNDADDDVDDLIDGDDPGCTKPYYNDDSEASIWDTDLTAVLAGISQGEEPKLEDTESVFFDGTVNIGSEEEPITSHDFPGGGGLGEQYIDGVYNEDNYGGGTNKTEPYTGFPEGTILLDSSARAIDPPNPGEDVSEDGRIVGSEQTCGDGIAESVEGEGQDPTTSSSLMNCLADEGRTEVKYNSDGEMGWETEYEPSSQTGNTFTDYNGLACRDDNQNSDGSNMGLSCEDGTDAWCTDGSSSCGCGTSSGGGGDDATCDSSNDWSGDESNDYWYADGNWLREDSCNSQGTETYASGSEGSDATCNNYFQKTDENGTCVGCVSAGSSTWYGGDSASVSGTNRDWEETDSRWCLDYNVVDGGGEMNAQDKSTNKADNDPAGTYTYFTAYSDPSVGVWCGYDFTTTVDADGPKGYGDGFVVIEDGNIVATEAPNGQDIVGQRVWVDGSNSGRNELGRVDTSCPDGKTTCLKYIDFQTVEGTGDKYGKPVWTNVDDSITIDQGDTEEFTAADSYSVCKNINRINKKHGDGTELVQCDIEDPTTSDPEGGTGGGSYTEACEDEPGEWYVYMEGPEINNGDSVMDNNPNHYQACVDEDENGAYGESLSSDSCVVKGDPVAEGTVANVAPNPENSDAQYERGGNSPDWEVCLNIEDGTGDDVEGDNFKSGGDKGGEWYDLDSENAQDYLRSGGNDLVTGGDENDPNDIAYYWNDNINPSNDDQYNPQEGNEGTALEDDCGNPRFDSIKCDDQEDQKSRGYGDTDTFFSFFEEGLREEDFHPQGEDTDTGENFDSFKGVINRMQERSNQLEPGMETDAYTSSDYNIWEGTRGGEYADEWAISAHLNWSIDSTGTPYPPYSTWYRDASDQRTSPEDDSIDKMQKAFGNSYAAVATNDFTGESGVAVDPGDGVWIDPDAMKTVSDVKLTPEAEGWREALRRTDTRSGINNGFKIDITGKDAGIGMNISDSDDAECLKESGDGGCKVVANVTEWEKNDAGNIESELEPPMCGDDRLEFFVEQAGEIDYSNRYIGPYACADSRNSCYDRDSPGEPSIVDQGEYRNVNEPEEDDGRLKNDAEYCQKVDNPDHEDDFAVWYDQDYQESFCRENTLYGQDGVRWFSEDYVADYPQAVKGGIDDSWNDYLKQHGHDSYTSDTTATSSEVTVGGDTTPVPTGDFKDVTATLGFCGGDDESEYLVTQECNTRFCETDRTVQGVAKVPGSCVMRADDSLYENEISERSIYNPGERVEITEVQGSPEVACFNGVWFSDWPISFNEDQVEVPVGDTRTVSFDVINTRDADTTFKVTMEKDSASPSADQFAQFTEHSGDSFTTTVKETSSKTFRIELTGGNENLDIGDPGSDLTVRADAINAGLIGSDSVAVGIESKSNTGTGTSTETRDVPGVQTLQLFVMMLFSTLIYFTRRRS